MEQEHYVIFHRMIVEIYPAFHFSDFSGEKLQHLLLGTLEGQDCITKLEYGKDFEIHELVRTSKTWGGIHNYLKENGDKVSIYGTKEMEMNNPTYLPNLRLVKPNGLPLYGYVYIHLKGGIVQLVDFLKDDDWGFDLCQGRWIIHREDEIDDRDLDDELCIKYGEILKIPGDDNEIHDVLCEKYPKICWDDNSEHLPLYMPRFKIMPP